jgi:hypothetical protein
LTKPDSISADANYLMNRQNNAWEETVPPPAKRIVGDPLIQPIISAVDAIKA